MWPLQTGDAHVAPLEMLDVAARTERGNEEVSYIRGSPEQQQPTSLYINLWVERDAASRMKTLQLCAYIQLLWDIETMHSALCYIHTHRMQSHDCWYWTPVAVAVTP